MGGCHEGIRELGGRKNPARPKWEESGNRERPAEEEGRAHRPPGAGLCATVWGHSYACLPVVCDSFCLTQVERRDEACQPCTGIVLPASPLVASPSVIRLLGWKVWQHFIYPFITDTKAEWCPYQPPQQPLSLCCSRFICCLPPPQSLWSVLKQIVETVSFYLRMVSVHL